MYDVVIVGAGPAGSTCARICSGKGLKTVLLDKEYFPRHKPCAGAVSVRALSLLDFVLPDAVIEKECYGVRIEFEDRSVEIRKDELIAVLVNRDDFDRVLAEKAAEKGALFLQGQKVIDVVETNHSVIVSTETKTYEARYLIGADGVHSRVAGLVRPPFKKDELALAAVCQVPAIDEEVDARLDKTIILRFGIAPTGYGWLFPHRGNYSVGAAGVASEFVEPRKTLAAYARSLQVEIDKVRGHFIPLGGIPRRIAANRILLAGDAAGFADPLQRRRDCTRHPVGPMRGACRP